MSSAFGAIPADFLKRARHEAERYGTDPWIFLRELVQNSRDAGATTVEFEVEQKNGDLILRCADNGCGMSRDDVGAYLLRLYASKKEPGAGEDAAARAEGKVGRFGVGFWSILLFGPTALSLSTKTQHGVANGFSLDVANGDLQDGDVAGQETGTTITLRRRLEPTDSVAMVAQKLKKFAGAVTGLTGKRPPRLFLNRQPITETLEDKAARDGHFGAKQVKGAGFEGAVGLGRSPRVRLYAHGLLIREASDLDELLPRKNLRTVPLPGLHPVVHVNANGLDVLMNRQAVVEDKLLEALVTACAKEVWELQKRLLDKVAPISLMPRVRLYLAQPRKLAVLASFLLVALAGASAAGVVLGVESARGVPTFLTDAMAAIGVNVDAGARPSLGSDAETPSTTVAVTTPASTPKAKVRSIDQMHRTTNHVVVNDLSGEASLPPWGMTYLGPKTVFFRGDFLTSYDPNLGLRRIDRTPDAFVPMRIGKPKRADVAVRVVVAPGQRSSPLPLPFEHSLIAASVKLDGKQLQPFANKTGGVPIARFEPENRSRLLEFKTERRVERTKRAVSKADVKWPTTWQKVFKTAHFAKSDRASATIVRRHLQSTLRYSTSAADAKRFAAEKGKWLDRVLRTGIADCDVMNGVQVLALWELGIPARLVVGWVGHDGAIAPVLHAWTEYYNRDTKRWVFVDVAPARVSAGLQASTPYRRDVAASVEATLNEESHDERNEKEAASPLALPSAEAPASESKATDDASTPVALESPAIRLPRHFPEWARWALLALAFAFMICVCVIFLFALLSLRRNKRQAGEDPILDELVQHVVKHRGGPDPLGLRYRPFFPALRRRDVSLAKAERLMANDRLFAATPENRWAPVMRGTVLDATNLKTQTLCASLGVTDLEPLAALEDLDAPPAHPRLAEIASRFREAVPIARLRHAPGKRGVTEVQVRTARGNRIFVFVDVDTLVARIGERATPFVLAKAVTDAASVFHPHRLQILAPLADAELQPLASRPLEEAS